MWFSPLQLFFVRLLGFSFPSEHQESIPSINLQSIDQISQVIFNKYAVLVMQLKKLLQPTFNLTCQCWNVLKMLTQFRNNFVQKNIKNHYVWNLLRGKPFSAKQDAHSIFVVMEWLLKFQHQKLHDTEAILQPVCWKLLLLYEFPQGKLNFTVL